MLENRLYVSLGLVALLLSACGGGTGEQDLGDGGSKETGAELDGGGSTTNVPTPAPGSDAGGTTGGTNAAGSGGQAFDARDAGGAPTDAEASVVIRDAGTTRDASSGTAPQDGSAGTPDAGPDAKAGPTGSVPPELVGIWQETRSSAGDYTDGFGQNFSLTSGFNVQLRIAANGSYYWGHYASGVSSTCKTVSTFDQSAGVAILQGTTLTLVPHERRLDVVDCVNPGSRVLPNDPINFTISLQESRHFYGGLRTYVMTVAGASHPIDLTLLNRPPTYAPAAPAQPATFVLGQDPPYKEWQGLWVAANGTDSNFYDPASGKFYFPELNGSRHQWLRFAGEGYDTAVALQNINSEGVCKADLIYYERGSARVTVLQDVTGKGDHFVGNARMAATSAHLIVRIRECDQDDGTYEYDLPPLNAFYRWIYFASGPESFILDCGTFPRSEWQSPLCTVDQPGFTRRL
jgi:hypothetical protein